MTLVDFLLSVACGVAATVTVYEFRSWRREVREFAEQKRRDDEWDRQHGIRPIEGQS